MSLEKAKRNRDAYRETIKKFKKSEFNNNNIRSLLRGLGSDYISYWYLNYFLEKDLYTFKDSASRV